MSGRTVRGSAVPADDDRRIAWVWIASLLLVVLGHVLVFRLLARVVPESPLSESPPTILMELAPAEPAAVPPAPAPFVPPALPPQAQTPPPPPPAAIPDIPVPPEVPLAPAVVPVAPPPKPRVLRPVERQVQHPVIHPAERPTPPQQAVQTPAAPAPPAQRAAAAPPSPQVVATWQGRLLAHLERFKAFPAAAQRRGEQGIVMMRFRMDHGGHVLAVTMVHGSGYADLDAEAQAWITRADPMPALPPEMTESAMELTVPLKFELH